MNKNIWQLYKDSERGKKAIAAFTITDEILDDGKAIENKIKEIYPFARDYLGGNTDENLVNGFFLIEGSLLVDNLVHDKNESATAYFERVIDNIAIGWRMWMKKATIFERRKQKQRTTKVCAGLFPMFRSTYISMSRTILSRYFLASVSTP